MNILPEYSVGFIGPLGAHKVSPRELRTELLSNLVSVEGIVTKLSLVRPKLVESVHYCAATKKKLSRSHRDETSLSGLPTAPTYPQSDENGNRLQTEFGLSTFKDYQTLYIQEMPERAPPGQLPRSVEAIVEDDLVDQVKPGDRVRMVGIYRAVPRNMGKGDNRSIFQ